MSDALYFWACAAIVMGGLGLLALWCARDLWRGHVEWREFEACQRARWVEQALYWVERMGPSRRWRPMWGNPAEMKMPGWTRLYEFRRGGPAALPFTFSGEFFGPPCPRCGGPHRERDHGVALRCEEGPGGLRRDHAPLDPSLRLDAPVLDPVTDPDYERRRRAPPGKVLRSDVRLVSGGVPPECVEAMYGPKHPEMSMHAPRFGGRAA